MKLYLSLDLDHEEDHGIRASVSNENYKSEAAIKIDLTHWGDGSEELAELIFGGSNGFEAGSALIAAVAQNAFNAGVTHGKHISDNDLVGVLSG